MPDLDALLKKAAERKAPELVTQTADVFIADEVVTLKFTELEPRAWAQCTMENPPRPDVELDQSFGYNLLASAEVAARINGVVVDGDTETAPTPAQWAAILESLDGAGHQAIVDAVFLVNEHAQIKRLAEAKNLTEGKSKRKPRSPAK